MGKVEKCYSVYSFLKKEVDCDKVINVHVIQRRASEATGVSFNYSERQFKRVRME
jgi:hypothetical protein